MTSVQASLPELQAAMYTKLTGDAQFMALVTGVFDYGAAPQNQAYPFVSIGNGTEGPMNAFGTRGYDATIQLDIWDNSNGFKTCYGILARMNTLLDQQSLTLATQHHVGTWYDSSQALNDPGLDNIKHIPVKYKIFTQEQ